MQQSVHIRGIDHGVHGVRGVVREGRLRLEPRLEARLHAAHEPRADEGNGGGQRSDADRWMDWCTTIFLPQMIPVFLGLVKTPPEKRDMKAIETARVQWEASVGLLNAALAGKRYVAGDDFSMGDIPLGVFVHRWYSIPMQRADMPNVAAWYERLKARPAFVEHVIKAAG